MQKAQQRSLLYLTAFERIERNTSSDKHLLPRTFDVLDTIPELRHPEKAPKRQFPNIERKEELVRDAMRVEHATPSSFMSQERYGRCAIIGRNNERRWSRFISPARDARR